MSRHSQSSSGTRRLLHTGTLTGTLTGASASDHNSNTQAHSITTYDSSSPSSDQEVEVEEQGQEQEVQPPHTAEIGTLKKLSVSGGTAWLGSSSGVYFVNTVRRAFSAAFAATSSSLDDRNGDGGVDNFNDDNYVPASEDIITGDDATGQNHNVNDSGDGDSNSNGNASGLTAGAAAGARNHSDKDANSWAQRAGAQPQNQNRNAYEPDFLRRIVTSVGRPPNDRKLAMDLVTTFFRQTHPLFPFLHGPRFLEDLNEIYAAMAKQPSQVQQQFTTKHDSTGKSRLRTQTSKRHSSPAPSSSAGKNAAAAAATTATDNTNIGDQNSLGALSSVDPLKVITFQIIINIAALSHIPSQSKTSAPLSPSSTISSAHSLLKLILPLSTTPLLPTIQLLLAAELYLLSTISLRHSSTLAGLVLRLIYHAGLHRCPLRYASLTAHDCEIRKRIFWSAYALDRHLSLALGDPNTFQDSDIDVCLSRSGEEGEMHRAVARDLLGDVDRGDEWRMHVPRDRRGNVVLGDDRERRRKLTEQGARQRKHKISDGGENAIAMEAVSEGSISVGSKGTGVAAANAIVTGADTALAINARAHPVKGGDNPTTALMNEDYPRTHVSSTRTKQLREATLTAYVQYGKLTGRIIEIFHKSINFRFPKQDAIAFLTADIENWWNELPSTLTGDYNQLATASSSTSHSNENAAPGVNDEDQNSVDPGLIQQHRLLTPFFTLLYHQLLLLLNRPRLSLDQGTAEFQHGLQVCIRASRNTLTALRKHRENRQSMFLPGLLSAAWMAGLIIAFACQLGKYPKQRACADIKTCLLLLESMNAKWYTVKNIHKVLSLLLANIASRKANSNGYLSASRNEMPSPSTTVGVKSSQKVSGGGGMGSKRHTRKRTRDSMSLDEGDGSEIGQPSPKRDRDSIASTSSPVASGFRHVSQFNSPDISTLVGNTSNPPMPMQQDTSRGDFSMANIMPQQDLNFNASDFDFSSTGFTSGQQGGTGFDNPALSGILDGGEGPSMRNQQRAGAALYADPQDMAFAQSSHSMGLPEMPYSMDDQMFWGNMDSNLFDIFGAVSWESMTGSAGPMVPNPSNWDMSTVTGSGGGSTYSSDTLINNRGS